MRDLVLVAAMLALGACAHAPQRAAAIPAATPATAPVASATPAASTAAVSAADVTTTTNSGTTATAPAATGADASAVEPVAPPSPEQYGDLFDRMRVGFKLDDNEGRTAVDQQLRWYAGNPAYLERAFGRADLYLYHIVTELERRNMPRELALLPVVESAFEPYAYSSARASGLWQFIPGTGSHYGLKQDWWYDGRRDIVESTRAALDYLKALHDEFDGDWLLAIAAYNCGEMAVERAVDANRRAGRPIDFWNLRLPRETRAYVPKLLAMKRLVADPAAYGLLISPIPNQPYFARVPTYTQMNLKLAAEIAGITPEEVYELNPAFHRWATDPAGPHYLLVPEDAAEVFNQNITQLTADQRLGVTHHSVQRGDSVASVAQQYQTTVKMVRELNDMPTGGIAVGDDLRVPSAVPDLPAKVMLAAARVDSGGRSQRHRRLHVHVQVVRRGESLWTIARRHGMNVNTLASLNGMHPGDRLRAGQKIRLTSSSGGSGGSSHAGHGKRRVVYTVREGDTVSQIARLFQCSVPQLMAWNGLSSGSHLRAGQKLRIHLTPRSG